MCPVPCRAAGRSSSAIREVSGQYPAMLLPKKKNLFKKKRVFSMVVPSFVLVHVWRVEGSVCSTDNFSPIQAPALCWGRCKIRDFPLRLLGENKNPPHSMHTK